MIQHGDCLEVLRTLADNSVDSIVTDPPYGLSFMGKRWDYDVPGADVWAECLRVLKPGGYLLAFAGTRTQHRMAVRIEDAGFEIRDMIAWLYGSGFPKSLDVSKAIDKAAGAEREVVGSKLGLPGYHLHGHDGGEALGHGLSSSTYETRLKSSQITAPATEAARQWEGWGTALKPALEPITVARKPLAGTVAANVLAHGTGALNIDGCRVPTNGESVPFFDTAGGRKFTLTDAPQMVRQAGTSDAGRWPANLIHDGSEEVLAAFPDSNGSGPARTLKRGQRQDGEGWGMADAPSDLRDAGTGSAARFFYCAKASRAERNAGCKEVMTWEGVDQSPVTEACSVLRRAMSESTTPLLGDSGWSTFWSGSDITDRCKTAIRSIIETVSKTTTESRTSNFSQPWSTSASIRAAIAVATENGSSLAELAESTSQWSQATTDDEMASVRRAAHAVLLALSETSVLGRQGNVHSTVKPTNLMRYLCRLVTPPGGLVLDPFAGSGSTGRGAILEGFRFLGIEREAEYVEIARARIAAVMPKPEAPKPAHPQLSMFDEAAA